MFAISLVQEIIIAHLHFVSPLDDAEAAKCLRLLSRKFFDEISLFGLSPPLLSSSEIEPNAFTAEIVPGMEEGGKKLLCLGKADLLLLTPSPLRDSGYKLED